MSVKTIAGHTTIETGAGNDSVTVSNDQGTVDQITAHLTIDTGAGTADSVTVDDSSDTNDNVGTLTGTTLTGLDMPTVPEVQRIFVQADSGTYRLYVGTTANFRDFDFSDDASAVAADVAALFGILATNLRVTVLRTPFDVTYTITFLRENAVGSYRRLKVDETQTHLTPAPDSSALVEAMRVQQGTTTPANTIQQTLTVDATGGTFVLHFARPNSDGVLQDVHTAAIKFNASAGELRAAISAVLNPNGAVWDVNAPPSFRPFTDNIQVTKHGSTFLLTFQGANLDLHDQLGVLRVDASGLTTGTRQAGEARGRDRLLRRRDAQRLARLRQRRVQRPGHVRGLAGDRRDEPDEPGDERRRRPRLRLVARRT